MQIILPNYGALRYTEVEKLNVGMLNSEGQGRPLMKQASMVISKWVAKSLLFPEECLVLCGDSPSMNSL